MSESCSESPETIHESTSLNPQDEEIFQNQNVSDIFQETPNAGMKFNSEEELYDFYKKICI